MIKCPECFRRFDVIWENDGQGPPEFCPMCGEEIEYSDNDDIPNLSPNLSDLRGILSANNS